MDDRIQELEAEVAMWKEYAAELGRQLAALRKAKASKATPSMTPGFERFWAAWPASSRKANKKGCLAKWNSAGLEMFAEQIVQHVEAMKLSRDWTKDDGAFIPAPLVYLNQERYTAPAGPAVQRAGSLAGIRYTTEGIDHDGFFN